MVDGTAWGWGRNGQGELGNGTKTDSNLPIQVSDLTDVTAIAGGGGHSLAISSADSLWAWGANAYGQFGNGTESDSTVPMVAPGLTSVTAITAGGAHSLFLGVYTPVSPPVVLSVVKMGNPFRLVVNGSNLQNGMAVYVNSRFWSRPNWKNASKVVIQGGASLKALVPKGTPTYFTFLNPDGGTTTVTGWSW